MCKAEDYKIFFEDAPVALVRTNVETGNFEMANNFAAKLFGCETVDDLIKNHKSTDFYSESIRRGLVKRLRRQGIIEEKELELHLPNDRRVWVKANFRLNCGGSCIECFLTDITEIVQLRNKHFKSMLAVSEKLDTKIAALA